MANRDTAGLSGTVVDPVGQTQTAPIKVESKPVITTEQSVSAVPQASSAAVSVTRWGAGIVVVALLLLWVFGGIVFKNAKL